MPAGSPPGPIPPAVRLCLGYSDRIDTSHSGREISRITAAHRNPRPGRTGSPLRTPRRRAALAGAAVVVLLLGLFTRSGLPGILGDASGGFLYAVLIYLLLAFALPRARYLRVAAAAVVLCVLIELFQLTPYPARWGAQWPPLRLVLGTTFNAWDLPAYVAGAAAASLLDLRLRRRSGGRRPAGGPPV